MHVSFVIPVFNERETLRPLLEGIAQHIAPHKFDVVFVDDGSTDGSRDLLHTLAREHSAVKIVELRGNFGKSAALAAGFAKAEGDLVFTMDSDLQDDPQEIPRFLQKIEEGYDVVCGWKSVRHDPWHKVIPSRAYNAFVAWLFALPLHDVNCGFKVYRREVVKTLRVYGELHRLIPVMAHGMNYRVGEIPVEHHPRRYGKSKYGLERFTRGALDVLTIWFLDRYSHAPGHFFGKMGIIQSALGAIAFAIAAFLWFRAMPTSVIAAFGVVGLVLFATGGLTFCMGLLAELVLRHFVRIDPDLYIEAPKQSG
ncbi:MAG: glycosyl transferase family 2 [Candidatus Hydrogenedentota bacterium]